MQCRHDVLKLVLAHNTQQVLEKAFPQLQVPDLAATLYDQFTQPPQEDMGHLAFPCFSLSKICRVAPAKIAQTLMEKWETADALVDKVVAQGPYLNFFLSMKEVGKRVLQPLLLGEYFKIPLTQNSPVTMIEYSQPNTHKELHVGHMRNLSLGHSLVLLHEYCGYKVHSCTFPGDVGTHVAKCLWYYKNHKQEPVPDEGRGAFLGKLYTLAETKLQAEKGTEQEEKNRQELTLILAQLERKEGEFFELWKVTRMWSIDQMKKVYEWSDVKFEHWFWESDVDSASVKLVKKYYEEGQLIKSEGAIGMDLSEEKLGFCMLLKSDGMGLYAAKDLELARRKFEDYHIERSLYVVDSRQSHHFAQVFKVLEKLGFPFARQCLHLSYEFVELPEGAMSSRKGNIVPILDLIRQMVDLIKKDYLERYRGQWEEKEIELTANQVALGAIKYGMLRIDPQRKIVFEMKNWLKLDGESGPYLQYVHARISSLCKKLQEAYNLNSPFQREWYISPLNVHWEVLTGPSETQLMFKLTQFNEVVLSACEQYRPAYLCTYLYELGKLFNHFYAECPMDKAPTAELRLGRYMLSTAVGMVMREGLGLLGIPAPTRM